MNPMNYLALLGIAVCSNHLLPAESHFSFPTPFVEELNTL